MIGLFVSKKERNIAKEFFEIFKTPWEFYNSNSYYDVVIATRDDIIDFNSKVIIIYISHKCTFDIKNQIIINPQKNSVILKACQYDLPIFKRIITFKGKSEKIFNICGTSKYAGIIIQKKKQKTIRVGFNLFEEIDFLFKSGQPEEYAKIPTCEIHILILKNFILTSGVPLVEIPPVPDGYKFTVCLTHDVDFFKLKDHKLDQTMFGFLFRASFGCLYKYLIRNHSIKKMLKNWISVLKLPGLYLGIVRDYFYQFDKYLKIEKDIPSTFFFIPFMNRTGNTYGGKVSKKRACRYDILNLKNLIKELQSAGCEIGLHGIDVWRDPTKGRLEYGKIANLVGKKHIGNRVHWLFYDVRSPNMIEESGLYYDSTFGYNNAVGYRAGTSQVFRPPGAKTILELPMLMQDTALFFKCRMNLSEKLAWKKVNQILRDIKIFGGTLTINWHQRSLGPERLWDEFYLMLLNTIKNQKVWFARAKDSVRWFNNRRLLQFNKVEFQNNRLRLCINGFQKCDAPGYIVRVYRQNKRTISSVLQNIYELEFIDIPLKNKTEISIIL